LLLGGLYALFACGLSLLFGVMEVINLAQGALAVIAAYLAVSIAPDLGLPEVWSFAIVVPIFVVLGYALQRSLIQPSINRGPLTTLLVTFGMAVVIENVLLEVFSADSHSVNTGALKGEAFHLSGQISVGYISLATFVVAVVVLVGLQLGLSRSTTGRRIRAVADDREASRLVGIDYRHTFGIAAAIAFATIALAGVAYGMYSSFAPTSGVNLLLFAFEAVVIGGLGSLWGTLLGGMVLGVAQAVGYQINPSDGVIAGHLVFLAILAVRPQGLIPGRISADQAQSAGPGARHLLSATWLGIAAGWKDKGRDRLRRAAWREQGSARRGLPRDLRVRRSPPGTRWIALLLLAGVVILAYLPYVVYSGTTDTLVNFFILLIMASMWNLLAGYAGLVSVGQQAYIGLGAYLVLIVAQHGLSPFGAIPIAAIGCAVVALPVSWLVFRLRGGYFAIATWVVADVFELVISRFGSLGGGTGKSLPGLSLSATLLGAYTYWAALGLTVLTFGGIYLLLRGRLGLALTAVRDDEIGARSAGVRVARAQRIVYLVSALGCGAAGSLLIISQLNVEPVSAFTVQWSAEMIFVTIIGGLGTMEGPIVGTIVFFVLQQTLSQYGAWYLIILGSLAVVVAIWVPRGLWGFVAERYNVRLFPVGYWRLPERPAPTRRARSRRPLEPAATAPGDSDTRDASELS
jgi:branched-chain amino acid transport system permease protein